LLAAGVVARPVQYRWDTLPVWRLARSQKRRHKLYSIPGSGQYSRFCELYREWEGTLDPVLRQVQVPGQKMFVDWAGQTVPIHNPTDGTLSQGHLFVAVLGASNKTFVEAFPNEQLPCWIAGHVHAYAFYGGVARVTVPDNPKTAVVRACRYEPQLHRSYAEMAEYYGTVVLPARPLKPRDKAHVETGVQMAGSTRSSLRASTIAGRVSDDFIRSNQCLERLARPPRRIASASRCVRAISF
ncbi:MAG: IS21 family transposase, partial [Verrucomicrobia bacterium]|nr:IS21 family transposase [Verrucomicrobiota bacterium]